MILYNDVTKATATVTVDELNKWITLVVSRKGINGDTEVGFRQHTFFREDHKVVDFASRQIGLLIEDGFVPTTSETLR